MQYSSDNLRHDMNEVIENHPHDPSARGAIRELADKLQIKLKPVKIEVKGYAFNNGNGQLSLYEDNEGRNIINIVGKLRDSGYDWGVNKVRLTIQEVMDDA